jgi:ankyrin repeat protein
MASNKGATTSSYNAAAVSPVTDEEGSMFLGDAKRGDLEAVKAFVAKHGKQAIDVTDTDWLPRNTPKWKIERQTAIRMASGAEKYDVVKFLAESGADVNKADKRGYTPLMVSHRPKMAALLLKHGARIDQENEEGNTALMWPNTDVMIRYYIRHGADIEHRNKEGMTPLINIAEGHFARGKSNAADNLKAMLDGGAKIDAQDNEGRTALIMAASHAKYDWENEKSYREMIPVLLERGADPLVRDKSGKTAADHAREDGQTDVAELIEEYTVLRQESLVKAFNDGAEARLPVMKPLKLKPFALPRKPNF